MILLQQLSFNTCHDKYVITLINHYVFLYDNFCAQIQELSQNCISLCVSMCMCACMYVCG